MVRRAAVAILLREFVDAGRHELRWRGLSHVACRYDFKHVLRRVVDRFIIRLPFAGRAVAVPYDLFAKAAGRGSGQR